MADKRTESCGRCAMTTVVDAVSGDCTDTEQDGRDPFHGSRIEVREADLRRASPGAYLERVTDRLNDAASRFIYGR
ncbi:hypothetical protein ACNS7O_06585 [Haloferacaceae archaeon DSL9]